MTTIQTISITDEVLDFLAGSPSAEEILAFKVAPETQDRMSYLLEQNRNNALTETEREELEEFSPINHLLIMLKGKVRLKLKAQQKTPTPIDRNRR